MGLEAAQFDNDQSTEAVHLIRSPIAGKIVHSDLSEGKFVEAFEHLFEIVNLDAVWIKLQILEKDIQQVTPGQRVELTLLDQASSIAATIERIDAALDPQTQVCWAWATAKDSTLIPGQVGSARIQLSSEAKRLTVPTKSVYSDGLKRYVFVEEAATGAASEYRKRNVVLGRRTFTIDKVQHIEVLQGDVYPGDRVVIQGGHELSSLFFLGVLKLSAPDRTHLGIRTALAEERPLAAALNLAAVATLPPEARWTASSQLAGTIQAHNLSPGQPIRAGELLFEIASPDFHTLQLDLLRASLDAELLRQRTKRLQQAGQDVFSRRALLETQSRADQLNLKADSLRRQLMALGLSAAEVDDIVTRKQIRSFLPVRSPIDGWLVRMTSTLGETVVANQALAEIQKNQDVWIEAQVPSQDVSKLSLNDRAIVSVLSNPTVQLHATVSRVGPVVSPTTRLQRIWLSPVSMPENFHLREGVQLSVALSVAQPKPALCVPAEAILRDGLHAFVFVQQANGYLDRRRVTTGETDGQWTEVLQGISRGEQVVVAGGRELQTAYASLR